MGVARDAYPRDGATLSFVASFAEVEVDVETGVYHVLDYLCVADVGTVIHPASLGGQILGRSILGIGHAIGQKWVYDQKYGVALARRFYQNKPHTILDVPTHMEWAAVELPDPETPVGARRRRASGRGRLLGGAERDFRRGGRRNLPARTGQRRRYPHGARGGKANDAPAHRQRVAGFSTSLSRRLRPMRCLLLLACGVPRLPRLAFGLWLRLQLLVRLATLWCCGGCHVSSFVLTVGSRGCARTCSTV